MMRNADAILSEALALPSEERARLVLELSQSFELVDEVEEIIDLLLEFPAAGPELDPRTGQSR